MLYFDTATTGRMKLFETLTIFEVGKTPLRLQGSWVKDGGISEVIRAGATNVKDKWTKVEFKSFGSVTNNKAGFRITSVNRLAGVYPAHLISKAEELVSNSRCYYTAY